LWAAAQDADARYRAEYGRPITRDALRMALRVSGPRATDLRRRLAGPEPRGTNDGPADGAATPTGAEPPAAAPAPAGSLALPPADPEPPAGDPARSASTTPDAPERKEVPSP
jgi:hypothetical protein